MPLTHTSSRNLRLPLELKALLGEKANFLRPGEHPWGAGFAALRRQLLPGPDLTVAEKVALSELQIDTDMLLSVQDQWEGHRSHLIDDLLSAEELRAIRFELDVMRYACQGSARRVSWDRYEEGSHDIRMQDPDIYVECTCLNQFSEEALLKAIKGKAKKKRVEGVPYVVAVGFDETVPNWIPGSLEQVMQARLAEPKWHRWFGDHREVSAALVFIRREPDTSLVESFGLRMRQTVAGSYIEIRSQVADFPLPADFRFNN